MSKEDESLWVLNQKAFMDFGKDIAMTLLESSHKDPLIVFEPVSYSMTTEMTPKVGCEVAPTLRERDYKDPSVVAYPKAMAWDGGETVPNLTTRSHDQFMPDKGNFCGILVLKE